jgi:hypothetical protein
MTGGGLSRLVQHFLSGWLYRRLSVCPICATPHVRSAGLKPVFTMAHIVRPGFMGGAAKEAIGR